METTGISADFGAKCALLKEERSQDNTVDPLP